jgi:hypothetical protein
LIERGKKASTGCRQAFRIALEPLLSTKVLCRGGVWLRDAGRGPQESPRSRVIAVIARDRKTKTLNTEARETRRTAKVGGLEHLRGAPHTGGIPGVEFCKPFKFLIVRHRGRGTMARESALLSPRSPSSRVIEKQNLTTEERRYREPRQSIGGGR